MLVKGLFLFQERRLESKTWQGKATTELILKNNNMKKFKISY